MKKFFIGSTLILVSAVALTLSGCSEQGASKQELIAIYNDFAKKSPPALGEGIYPLTANFSTIDKGKEGKAQSLVDVGFLNSVRKKSTSKSSHDSVTDNIVTYDLTEEGKKQYISNVNGFAWGYNSALSASNLKIVTASGQKTAFVTLKTKIINIPEWAKQPVILANYPIVKETLDKNEFYFNAVYKLDNGKWSLIEVVQAPQPMQ